MAKLPRLPDNARYHYGQQMGCKLHWGMLAEVFESGVVKKEDYRYFIFMSSAVRGPFVPTYALVSCCCVARSEHSEIEGGNQGDGQKPWILELIHYISPGPQVKVVIFY